MKATLFTLTMILSASAFACPNLAGTWTCKYQDGTSDSSVVTQQAIANGILYTIVDAGAQQQLAADGQSRPVSDEGMNGTLIVSCQADTGIRAVEQVTGAPGSDVEGITASINLTYALTAVDAMNITATIDMTAPGQPSQTQTQASSCTRN